MPYEGYKGGGYDRSSLIRTPYQRTQLPTSASNEQMAYLSFTHPSLQADFQPTRRYESNITTPYGRLFASRATTPYSEWPDSLMAANFRGPACRPATPSLLGPVGVKEYALWRKQENMLGLKR